MKLIALRPCSFGGKKFYIGDEVPEKLVLSPKLQKERGTLRILEDIPGNADKGKAVPVKDTAPVKEPLPSVSESKAGDGQEAAGKRTPRKKSGK